MANSYSQKSLSVIFGVCWLLMPLLSFGQKKLSTEEYIETYKDIAVAEMYRTGIPASITLAQGILESGSGNSRLAVEGNNHFGIKCHEWNGDFIREDDDRAQECFRKYADAMQSYIDHSEFLMSRSRYAFLFSYEKTDYKKWAHGLKKAGYATNPKYAPLLIDLIDRYKLHQYDYASVPKLAYNPKASEDDPVSFKNNTSKEVFPTGIFQTNRVDAVILQPNQQLADVAKAYEISVSRLERYNEVNDGFHLVPGMKVYLQPKRNKGEEKEHKVKKGETMFVISQNYGIKLERLYARNQMEWGSQPAVGETLRMRGNRNNPPKLRKGDPAPDDDGFLVNVIDAINPFDSVEDDINKPENPKPQPLPEKPVAETEEQAKETEEPISKDETAFVDSVKNEKPEKPVEYNPYKEIEEGQPKYTYEDSEDEKRNEETPVKEKMKDKYEVVKSSPVDKETVLRHTVRDGETLYGISRQYEVSVAEIKQWNELPDNNIKIGQTLIVSGKD